MGIQRNSIEVIGIATEDELPRQINGELVEFSETEYIYVPENKPLIYSISRIEVKHNIRQSRTIDAPTGRIVVLEGSRKIKVTYRPISYYEESYTLKFDLPFNSFIDIPNNTGEIKSIDIYTIDAYFKLMSSRKIYCFMVYMINTAYQSTFANRAYEDSITQVKVLKQFENAEE